jgi:hypothetical protein
VGVGDASSDIQEFWRCRRMAGILKDLYGEVRLNEQNNKKNEAV